MVIDGVFMYPSGDTWRLVVVGGMYLMGPYS